MVLSTKAITAKMSSVKNIRKITKAMELVAASKMKKAVAAVLGTREYAELALNLLFNISKDSYHKHRLLEAGKGNKTLIVVMTSNKGLCGGFNANIEKKIHAFLKEHNNNDNITFITVGKYAEHIARRLNKTVVASFVDFFDHVDIADMGGLTKVIIDEFDSGEYNSVFICSTNYISGLSQKSFIRQLLPVSPEIVQNAVEKTGPYTEAHEFKKEDLSVYVFEPNQEEVLNLVLPRLVEVQIYQALLESLASEHSARMVAMKNASDNAKELAEELRLSYNKARQAAVTSQISEIAAGANAQTIH